MTRHLTHASPALELEDGLRHRVHAVQIPLAEQATVGVGRQTAVDPGLARPHERTRLTTSYEAESLEAEQDRAGEAVVDLGEVDLMGTDPGRSPEIAGEQAGVVARVVLPEQSIADVQPRPAADTVGGALDHRRRVPQAASQLERGHEHGAR